MRDPDSAAPLISVFPFVALLAGIAIFPLVAPHFWERNRNKAIITLALAVPVALWLVLTNSHALLHSGLEYLSFICLLGALFIVAGGIHVEGDLIATPKMNVAILGLGAALANIVGTTGASMLLIRFVLRTNSERKRTAHLPLFFILVVSNCGGLLTPLGDPPLFLGYLQGVPFFWTLSLFPIWLLVTGYLLAAFYWVDRRAYAREALADLKSDAEHIEPLRVTGRRNIAFLAGIVGAVFLPTPARELTMLALTIASLLLGGRKARQANDFSFGPIAEVAILFAGIFVTMVPALALLKEHGSDLGLRHAWQYFLVTGGLSSVLDNAPTYLTFLSAAQGLHLPADVVGVPHQYLLAISVGAVLMGANTYIGNGPNFMVKAIADSQGYKTDSFGAYAFKATLILAPAYLAITLFLMMRA